VHRGVEFVDLSHLGGVAAGERTLAPTVLIKRAEAARAGLRCALSAWSLLWVPAQ